jgi:hypothetical protein
VLQNIPIDGGAVTVSGSHVPPDDTVYVLGVPVPVDDQRRFVVRQILPRGPEQVSVKIANDRGEGLEFTRNLSIAVDDSFFVGLADFTAGARSTSGPIELVTGDATLARRDYIDGTHQGPMAADGGRGLAGPALAQFVQQLREQEFRGSAAAHRSESLLPGVWRR